MTVGWLSSLFGRPDPTQEWPLAVGPAPEFDTATGNFGPLAFGAPLEEARFLGRPDAAKWRDGVLELFWAPRGLILEFVDGKFAYVAWLIGPDPFVPEHRDLKFSAPRPAGGPSLDRSTTEADLVAWLGATEDRLADADEIVLTWMRDGFALEFELTPAGALKRFNAWEI